MLGKRLLSLLLFLGLFFLSASRVAAASYYFDSINGDDEYSGDGADTAWQTLTPLRNINLEPGDTVYFKRGSSWDTGYAYGSLSSNLGLVIDNSGTATQPITFTAYGEGPAPVFSNSYSAIQYVRAFTIQSSYIRMEQLAIRDVKEAGIYITASSTYVTLDSLDISRTAHAIAILGSHNVISNSRLHDTFMLANNDDDGDNDSGAVGVLLMGSYNVIQRNIIENNLQQSFDYGTDGGAVELHNEGNLVEGNIIQHNIIRNNDTVTEVGGYGNPTFINNVFAYNLLVNNSRLATIHNSGTFGASIAGLQFHNNTIYENTAEWTGIQATRSKDGVITFGDAPTSGMLELKNNIFWIQGINKVSNFDTFDHDYNLYYLGSGTASIPLSSNEIEGAPLFVSLGTTKNFHLQSGSPARNAGLSLEYIEDLDRNTVPQESIPDLGAYEYAATPVTPVPSPSVSPSPSLLPSPNPSPLPSVSPGPGCTGAVDINNDGRVNIFDFAMMSDLFFEKEGIAAVDLNCDGKVNVIDFAILSESFEL